MSKEEKEAEIALCYFFTSTALHLLEAEALLLNIASCISSDSFL
jgi:hypothetical protein